MTESIVEVLIGFLRRGLRPLARLCLRRGLQLQHFIEAAKGAFVDAAEAELRGSDVEVNTSKIAAMTGLQRRDVNRVQSAGQTQPHIANTFSKILGQWAHDPKFSRRNKARPLTIEGMGSEFATLVQSVSKDLNPYTVRFELERIGAVREQNGKLLLTEPAFETNQDPEQGLDLLAQDLDDLVQSVEENVFARETVPNLHISTRYDNICIDAVPKVREWLLKKGAQVHAEAREFMARLDKDTNPTLYDKQGGVRVTLGSFTRLTLPTTLQKKLKGKKRGH